MTTLNDYLAQKKRRQRPCVLKRSKTPSRIPIRPRYRRKAAAAFEKYVYATSKLSATALRIMPDIASVPHHLKFSLVY